MRRHAMAAVATLTYGLLFGLVTEARANYLYNFSVPNYGNLAFVETAFIPSNESGSPPQTLNNYLGSGDFDSTDATTFYFSNVSLFGSQGQPVGPFVGFNADVGSIPGATGTYPVTSYLLTSFSNGGFVPTTVNGGTLDITEVPFGAPAPLPEPATLAVLGLGAAGVAVARRRRSSGG